MPKARRVVVGIALADLHQPLPCNALCVIRRARRLQIDRLEIAPAGSHTAVELFEVRWHDEREGAGGIARMSQNAPRR